MSWIQFIEEFILIWAKWILVFTLIQNVNGENVNLSEVRFCPRTFADIVTISKMSGATESPTERINRRVKWWSHERFLKIHSLALKKVFEPLPQTTL